MTAPRTPARAAAILRAELKRRSRRAAARAERERLPTLSPLPAAQPERLLPATHSPLWLLPAGLSDDELMAGYGGGVW